MKLKQIKHSPITEAIIEILAVAGVSLIPLPVLGFPCYNLWLMGAIPKI